MFLERVRRASNVVLPLELRVAVVLAKKGKVYVFENGTTPDETSFPSVVISFD
jgi:hypothetical protein